MDDFIAFCIDCEKLVNVSDVELHLRDCVRAQESENCLGTVDKKLKNYRKTVKRFFRKKNLEEDLRYIVKSCIEKSKEAEKNDLESLSKTVSRLEAYLKKHENAVIIVLVERLLALIEEKALMFIESATSRIKEEEDLAATHRKIPSWISSEYMKAEKIELEEEDQDWGTLQTSYLVKTQAEYDLAQDSDDESEDRLFTHFKNFCKLSRLSFSYKHPAQKISISSLYQKSKRLKIASENWENFIVCEMKSLEF